MKARTYLVGLVCILLLSINTYSQHMNAKNSPCNTNETTPNLANCLWKAWHSEDRDLNAYYQVISKHLRGNEIPDLRRAEKAWGAYRDLNCKAEKALYDGGTAVGPVYDACMEAMTRHRLAELRTMYDWRVSK